MVTILAIQNPGETEATILRELEGIDLLSVIEKHGAIIEHGAFVSLTDRDLDGNTCGVRQFIADRIGNTLYLQNNEFMRHEDERANVDDIGSVVESGYAPLPAPKPELEAFTVFGTNDAGEGFVAAVAATEDTVYDVGVQAGLVDQGYEADVMIVAILKGDQSGVERVTV